MKSSVSCFFSHDYCLINPSSRPMFRLRYRVQQWWLTGFDRNITDPRALALVLEQAEEKLAKGIHPDPYRREYNWSLSK